MRRREFIALLGGAATAWAVAARAQQPVQPVVTLINARRANAGAPLAAEFRKGLSQTGFVEGRDVAVEYHWLGGQCEAAAAIIDDAVKRNVAVIATPANSPASVIAKAAATTIPIVFGAGEDPVTLGLVASLAATPPASISSPAKSTQSDSARCTSCCRRRGVSRCWSIRRIP
jgi:putative ABC transport system substrate-binding protein